MVEELDAACPENLGNGAAVAKGIGMEVHIHILEGDAELLVQKLLGVEDMAGHALQVGHILVQFHPGGAGKFKAAFLDALLHPAEQSRIVELCHPVYGALGLGEGKLGIIVHHIQHGTEGRQGHIHRLVETPQPVHVDMGMGHAVHIVGLCPLGEGHQHLFRSLAGRVGQRVFRHEGIIKLINDLLQQSHFFRLGQCFRHGEFGKETLTPVAKLRDIDPVIGLLRFHPGDLVIHGHKVPSSLLYKHLYNNGYT